MVSSKESWRVITKLAPDVYHRGGRLPRTRLHQPLRQPHVSRPRRATGPSYRGRRVSRAQYAPSYLSERAEPLHTIGRIARQLRVKARAHFLPLAWEFLPGADPMGRLRARRSIGRAPHWLGRRKCRRLSRGTARRRAPDPRCHGDWRL